MKNWLKKRMNEPTTYMGLALVLNGVGTLGKIDEAPAIADAIVNAAGPLSSGDYGTAVSLILGGLLGVLMREKGR